MNIMDFRLHQQEDENSLAQHERFEQELETFYSPCFGFTTQAEIDSIVSDPYYF